MQKFAPLFVIVAAALWGVDGIVLRPSLYGLPVPLVVLIESSIVAVLLTPFFLKKRACLKQLKGKDWAAFVAVAVFGGAIGTMAITRALFYVNYVNLSIVVLIQKLQPLFAIGLATLILHEKPRREFYFWAMAAIFGAYIMTFGFSLPRLSPDNKTAMAALFAVIATASFGASTVLSKRGLKNIGFEMGTYLRFVITTLIMLPLVAALGDFPAVQQVSSRQALVFLVIAFSTGGPAIFLYYYGLKNIPASVATICELAFPLTAVLLEYLLRGNLMSPIQWVGVVMLIGSMLRVSRLKSDTIQS